VGRNMHEDPQIPNFGEPGRGPVLASGMTLAIEPMITAGGPEVVVRDDRWRYRLSARRLRPAFREAAIFERCSFEPLHL
jgi:methionine aminopeptidase